MDNPIPELSPDIEWMLESGQASAVMLADALVREYFQPIYQFGLAFLNDSRLAEKAAVESLSLALVQSYSYSAAAWRPGLFQIALQVCREKRASFSSQMRPPINLKFGIWIACPLQRIRGRKRTTSLARHWENQP